MGKDGYACWCGGEGDVRLHVLAGLGGDDDCRVLNQEVCGQKGELLGPTQCTVSAVEPTIEGCMAYSTCTTPFAYGDILIDQVEQRASLCNEVEDGKFDCSCNDGTASFFLSATDRDSACQQVAEHCAERDESPAGN